MDVAEHERHRIGVALEPDAERMPHRAVRSVAADDVAKPGLLLGAVRPRQLHRGTMLVLVERDQRDTAVDVNPEPAEMASEQALRLVLRDSELAIGQVAISDIRVLRRMPVNDRAKPFDPEPGVYHLPGDAHILPHLERTRCHADRPAIGQRALEPIDDAAAHPVPREFAGHSRTRLGRANDQDFCCHRSLREA